MKPPMKKREEKPRFSLSWSIDENHIYLDDDVLDERLMDISFSFDGQKTKNEKIKFLEGLVENLPSLKERDK